jgi:hypothetical protein
MGRDEHWHRERSINCRAANVSDPHWPTRESPSRRCTKCHDHLRIDRDDLLSHPGCACRELTEARLAMDPLLPALLVAEMLHGIRHVDVLPSETCGRKRVGQDPPRGPDEGPTFEILLIARLLADEHDLAGDWPFAEYDLRRIVPEVASATRTRGVPKIVPRRAFGHPRLGSCLRCSAHLGQLPATSITETAMTVG